MIGKTPSPLLRCGLITTLHYLTKECIDELEEEDTEWLVAAIIGILQDPSLQSLSYEETTYLRTRLSYLIRSSFTSTLNEVKLLQLASQLARFVSGLEQQRSDQELQLALMELSYVITVLGESATSVFDEVNLWIDCLIDID